MKFLELNLFGFDPRESCWHGSPFVAVKGNNVVSFIDTEGKSPNYRAHTKKEQAMSLGEERVRIKFNPSDNSLVSQIKQKSAELIDLCDLQAQAVRNAGGRVDGEVLRLWALAQTHYEDAAMWAVKAATF